MKLPGPVAKRHVLDKILKAETESITLSAEPVLAVCRDGNVTSIPTSNDGFYPVINDDDVARACGGKKMVIAHAHGATTSLPSKHDHDTHDRLFASIPGLEAGCIAGIDGIRCIDKRGKESYRSFSPEQERRVLEATGTIKMTGSSAWCDAIGNGKYFCTVQDERGERPIGLFDQVSFAGGVTWAGETDADVAMVSPHKNGKVSCYGTTGKVKELSCMIEKERKSTIHRRQI